MNIIEAYKALDEGKIIYRKSEPTEKYSSAYGSYGFGRESILADDWEIYKESPKDKAWEEYCKSNKNVCNINPEYKQIWMEAWNAANDHFNMEAYGYFFKAVPPEIHPMDKAWEEWANKCQDSVFSTVARNQVRYFFEQGFMAAQKFKT